MGVIRPLNMNYALIVFLLQMLMKRFALKTLVSLVLITGITCSNCFSQKMEEWLFEKELLEKRKRNKLKVLKEFDTKGNLLLMDEYDRDGRLNHRVYYHLPSNNANQGEFQDKRLRNELWFGYNNYGDLEEVINEHEHISGTTYGTERDKQGEYGLPYIGPPFELIVIKNVFTWAYIYDNHGRKIEELGPTNSYGVYYYMTKAYLSGQATGGQGLADKNKGAKFTYQYDDKGNMIAENHYYRALDSVPTWKRSFAYDSRNNLVNETEYTTVKSKEIKYIYDSKNRLIEKVDHYTNHRHVFTYDDEDNLIQVEDYIPSKDFYKRMEAYHYDENGNTIKIGYSHAKGMNLSYNGAVTYEYDNKRRITKKTGGGSPCSRAYLRESFRLTNRYSRRFGGVFTEYSYR